MWFAAIGYALCENRPGTRHVWLCLKLSHTARHLWADSAPLGLLGQRTQQHDLNQLDRRVP
jgi:hypothetical protein